ncbi:MAG: hypothetical protein KF718_31735 [Polyangiaceae bacterium]|nr:hypothetical protein [Polyangiaceae bacterium]
MTSATRALTRHTPVRLLAFALALGTGTAATASTATAQELTREEENYERNLLVLRLSVQRTRVDAKYSFTETAWFGRADFGIWVPFEDGASSMLGVFGGLGGAPVDDGFVFSVPVTFVYGYRTPTLMGYLGGVIGVGGGGFDHSASGVGRLFGAAAGVGVDVGRVHFACEVRFEHAFLEAGHGLTFLGVGPVLSFVF